MGQMRYMHVLVSLLGGLLRLVPRRRRFPLVRVVARAALPLLRWNGRLETAAGWRLDTEEDLALALLLSGLYQCYVPVDPPVAFDGLELLDAAAAEGRGVLLLAPHTKLAVRVVSHLHDSGYGISAVVNRPAEGSGRRRAEVPRIWVSPHFLLRVRDALAGGETVFAMIDRRTPVAGMTRPIETVAGTVHVTDALIRLAARARPRVLFLAAGSDRDGLWCTIDGPRQEEVDTGEALTGAFARFVQGHALRTSGAARRATAGGRAPARESISPMQTTDGR